MSDRSASATARGVAVLRAAHQVIDAEPLILRDPVILRLLGADTEQRIRAEAEALQTRATRGLRSHVLLRSRFAEDELAQAVERGTLQYVLLGAGLETFAYRQPAWAEALTVVEVDHPASQAAKREALAKAGLAIPGNLRFADIDFERESLAEGLARCGVDATRLTFFSWLGVSVYLTREAIETLLRTVASFPSGSEIVFTFAQPREAGDEAGRRLAEGAAAVGEPWVSYFTPAEVEELLEATGFGATRFLEREEAARRYYSARSDGLEPPRRTSIAAAVV